MKIKYNLIERITIDDFAKQHGLVMQVHERTHEQMANPWGDRFFCYFEYLEEKDGSILRSTAGNGTSPRNAIENYCNEISNKLMVYKATSKKLRKEIQTPFIIADWKEEKIK